MDKTYKYKTFKSLGKGGRKPKDHVMISVHLISNVKQDGMHKARLVAGGNMAGPNIDIYYSSVVSLRAIRMMIYRHEGHLMLILKAFHGLKTFGIRFHEKFAETMCQLGFMPSTADSDV
eukprot:7025502-Ditylum_brightwellii.AAC.1